MAKAPVPLDFYAGLVSDQQRKKADPIDDTLARMQVEDTRRTVIQSGSPDEVAKATRVAREAGEAPALVEDRVAEYEKLMGARRLADVAAQYAPLGEYFGKNPRAAVAAQDDHRSLGLLGEAWDTIKKVPESLDVAGYTAMQMANDTFYTLSDIGSAAGYPVRAAAATVINSPIGRALGIPAYDPDKQEAQVDAFKQSMRSSLKQRTEAARPDYRGPIQEGLLRGLDTSVATVMALVTRDPKTAASVLGTTVGSQGYQDARADGIGVGDATRYGITQGTVEGITELAPASSLLTSLANKTGAGKTIAHYLASELPGEMSATFLQSLSDWQVRNPDKTYNDWVLSLPGEMQQTVLGVLGGGTVTAGAVKGAQVATDLVGRAGQAMQARAHAQAITRFDKAATESKLRQRDPEGYSEMVGEVAKQAGVEHVFIPADAVREYMQSDSYDPYSDPLESYRDQIDEAYETGGDVVLPADFALGTLPGTPAFNALRDDMRTSSGGMSPREAQTFEESMADVVAEIEAAQQQEFDDLAAQVDAQGKLIQSIQDKLQNAGFTPYTASVQAELIARRISTRAARMGMEVTGGEFTTEVRSVLPPELAKARDADATDLVINALRKGKDPTLKSGPSLLEWISARGGVNDTGGDLRSMGLDQWHKGKPGKRKLLRAFDPKAAMGGVSGQGDYGVDTTLRAAIEAGYFPELVGMEGEGVSQLDTQALLDAMSAELAGVKRYAADARIDGYRAAAQELEDMLVQRGLDPAGMSDAELRAAIMQLDAQGEGGFEQLADSIDIDGVQRPTRNSEGQPLAGSEAGVRAFWAWFSDSKVVDAEGRPLVVYHGGAKGTEAFDPTKAGTVQVSDWGKGIYFTPKKWQAEGYATDAEMATNAKEKALYKAIDVAAAKHGVSDPMMAGIKLGINSPEYKEVEAATNEWRAYRAELRRSGGGEVYSTYLKIENPEVYQYVGITDPYLAENAKADGRDGVIVVNEPVNGPLVDYMDEILVFDPTQIKSVNNRGTFDPADPRILFQSPREYYQSAYHGSPHIFDKFSLDKIGTGEGAQAYGWGLYFAGRKEIAEHYREALTSSGSAHLRNLLEDQGIDAQLVDTYISYAQGAAGKIGSFDRFAEVINSKGASEGQEAWRETLRPQLPALKAALKNTQGRLYKVEIPDDDEYLLWDKPLSEQPEKVKAGIEPFVAAREAMYAQYGQSFSLEDELSSLTGNDLYQEMAADVGSDKAASLALHNAGIAGIKYLDGSSRSQGDGSFNYVVFDDSRVSIQAYEQTFADGPRGRIRFEQVPVIELFQSRNLSTLVHELGHQFLEELRFDAETDTAPEQMRQDYETLKAWWAQNNIDWDGVGPIPVEAHEITARGFERFLMEGKSPSTALAKVFETIKGWMLSIYKKVEALRSPITPEVREVFDRMLATDEELAATRERQALMPLFKDAAAIGMTGPEFDAYTAQFDEARTQASSDLMAKTMNAVKRRVMADYRNERAVVEADITESVDNRPLFRALRNLKTMPISAEWLDENMGLDARDLLPKRVPPIYRSKGAHPDAVAEMSGYATGRQMIEALIGAELAQRQAVEGGDKRPMRERAIQTETDAEMNRRVGDPLADGTIEREALAAVNGEKQGELLASEIRALSRKTGQRPTPYRIAREWARSKVRGGVYATEASPSAIQRHARAVAKAGTEAEKAMLAGKFDEALRLKQRQMLSSALLAEAKAAHDEVTAAQKRMDKIARRTKPGAIDPEYLDQAQALLEQVDLRPRSQKSIDRQGKWAEWAAAREAEGFDVVVPASFEATLGKTNWTRLSTENLLALDQTIAQIVHLGRLKQGLLDNQERRKWDEIYDEAVASAGGLKGNPPRDLMEPGFWEAMKGKVLAGDAALLKMETVFDWLDGGNPNGVFNRIAFKPVADAQAREQDMLVDYYGRIKALFEAVPANVAKRWQDQVSPPFTNRETGLPERMKRHQLIAAALNVGNEGNLQRLTDGYGWNAAALLDYLNQELTAEEWQFVQGVWDQIDTLWPEIEAMEKRVNGVAPDKVEATEIVTPFGTLRGGYYPAIYDTARSYRQEENRAAGDNALFEPNAVRATTRSGSTKARADKVNAPILLDLGVINRHLGEVIHDITHREAVMQAWKFLTSERVMRAVDQALGVEIRQQMKPWVKFVANSWAMERAGNEGFGKFLTKLRANATIVGMGLRASTMMMQIAGYANATEVVGEGYMAKAIAQFYASPIETSRYVLENSDEVRHRMDTLDRDIRNELANMAASNPASKAVRAAFDAKRFFFHGIGYMDRVVSVPTWMAAYNKAVAEGMDHDQARYAGDKAVRQSQGAGAPKDMAAIQRGTGRYGEAFKLLTMFYTYLSAFYQRERTLYRDATGEDVRRPRDMPKLLSRTFWLLIVPPLLTELIRVGATGDGGPDDEEWWAQWTLRKLLANMLGPVPIVRDVFEPSWNAAIGNKSYNPSITPIQRGLESIAASAKDAGKIARGEETKKATKNALETVGYTTGLVPGQVASSTQFLVDVGYGDQDPETLSEWLDGLSDGKLEEE